MPDYVYALHDFLPELDDELSFKAGERIEVIEKDDQYHDGWWQVSRRAYFLLWSLHVGLSAKMSARRGGQLAIDDDPCWPDAIYITSNL